MLIDFPPANLGVSRAVWEAKESPSAVLLGSGDVEIHLFRWPRERRFTVLEDFALQVVERNIANSDAQIARILHLNESDIAAIFDGPGLKGSMQGDSSHRALPKDFSRKIPDGAAVVGEGDVPSGSVEFGDDKWPVINALEKFYGRVVGRGDLSEEQREWMKKTGARVFMLLVSAFRYDNKSWLFLCNGKIIPFVLNGELRKRCGKIGPKSAPSGAVCHRDEFWPWLKSQIDENRPDPVIFECARHDEDAMGRLRKETGIDAEVRGVEEKTKQEAVCLNGERFVLRGNFMCRAKSP